jgi:hypothetical protein
LSFAAGGDSSPRGKIFWHVARFFPLSEAVNVFTASGFPTTVIATKFACCTNDSVIPAHPAINATDPMDIAIFANAFISRSLRVERKSKLPEQGSAFLFKFDTTDIRFSATLST